MLNLTCRLWTMRCELFWSESCPLFPCFVGVAFLTLWWPKASCFLHLLPTPWWECWYCAGSFHPLCVKIPSDGLRSHWKSLTFTLAPFMKLRAFSKKLCERKNMSRIEKGATTPYILFTSLQPAVCFVWENCILYFSHFSQWLIPAVELSCEGWDYAISMLVWLQGTLLPKPI